MPEFFDKKEEVLDIQLTQYGKFLLGKGEFIPVYYGFTDDEILYDSQWAGYAEEQNDVSDRLKNDIVTLKVSPSFVSAEENRKNPGKQRREDRDAITMFLGDSEMGNPYLPAFTVRMYHGEISGTVNYASGSMPTLRVPQVSLANVEHLIYIQPVHVTDAEKAANPLIFQDNTTFKVEEDYLLIEILEENTDFSNDHFSIEVFEVVDEDIQGRAAVKGVPVAQRYKRENLKQLKFAKTGVEGRVKGDLLEEDSVYHYESVDLTSEYVEYFLDFKTDMEINQEVLCKDTNGEANIQGVFYDTRGNECPSNPPAKVPKMYDRQGTGQEEC